MNTAELIRGKFDISDDFVGYALAYYVTGVEFGWYSPQVGLSFCNVHSIDDLTELHLFNEDIEYRLIKISDSDEYIKIVITDDPDHSEYIDEYMYLIGEEWISSDGETTIVRERGGIKKLYLSISEDIFQKRVQLGVRNYLKYDEDDFISINNYRFTGLYVSDKDNSDGKVNHIQLDILGRME